MATFWLELIKGALLILKELVVPFLVYLNTKTKVENETLKETIKNAEETKQIHNAVSNATDDELADILRRESNTDTKKQ